MNPRLNASRVTSVLFVTPNLSIIALTCAFTVESDINSFSEICGLEYQAIINFKTSFSLPVKFIELSFTINLLG